MKTIISILALCVLASCGPGFGQGFSEGLNPWVGMPQPQPMVTPMDIMRLQLNQPRLTTTCQRYGYQTICM